jgi:hypothetical protein
MLSMRSPGVLRAATLTIVTDGPISGGHLGGWAIHTLSSWKLGGPGAGKLITVIATGGAVPSEVMDARRLGVLSGGRG